jgi:hypothetical protein
MFRTSSADHPRDMRLTTCPECGATAEVLDEGTVSSTDGPLRHVRIQCVRRHWFLMLDSLPDLPTADPDTSAAAAPTYGP